ncbi:MAG: ribosomal protein S18-alanine N-acetyltransferase [Eubacteriales bacterium]|nr:ribosomal protein S18-alanine N-acetyltransferase [Eubacteriales bacterium]
MIRTMQEADLKQIVALEQQIFSRPWSEQSFRSALDRQDTIYLVYETEGVIQGYLGIWCAGGDGDLCNMAVDARARRCGIAAGLLETGIHQCGKRGVQRIVLEVRTSNEPARRLYAQYGFEEIGIRKRYYTEPVEDAVLMECRIGV